MKIYQFIVGSVPHPHTTDSVNAYFTDRRYIYKEEPQRFSCVPSDVDWFIHNLSCEWNDCITLEIGKCNIEELSVGISLFFNKLLRHLFAKEEEEENCRYPRSCNIILNYTHNVDLAVELTTACLVSLLDAGYNYEWVEDKNTNICRRYLTYNRHKKTIRVEYGSLLLLESNMRFYGMREAYSLLAVVNKFDDGTLSIHDGDCFSYYTQEVNQFPKQPCTLANRI